MKTKLAAIALLATLPAGAALAGVDCRPTAQPQSWDAVIELARNYDWTLREMEVDDGCYEILATDPGGNVVKAKIDPETLEVVEARIKKFAYRAPMLAPAPSVVPLTEAPN